MKLHIPQPVVSAILILCLNCLIVSTALAQTNTWDGSSDANWNTPANWSLNHVPLAAEDVVIPNGITATITINTAAVCSSFTMNSGNTANTVTISGTNSLTVTNGVSLGAGTGTGDNKLLAVNGGTLSCASVTMTATGNDNRVTSMTLSTGTITVTGSITMNDTDVDRNIVNITSTGTLNVAGALTGGNLISASGSTVNYNGAGQTIRAVNYGGNLTLSGSGTTVLQTGTTTIGGNFTTSGTVSVTAVTGLSIGGNITLGNGTAFTAGSFTHNVSGNWVNNGATFTNTGSTINLNGAAQSIGGTSSTTFNNLTLSGTNTKTFNLSTAISATLAMNGVIANLSTFTTHTANALTFGTAGQNAGTWGGTGSGATNINTTYFAAATGRITIATKASTIYYSRQTGNWDSNTTWSTVTYANATNDGTFPVAGDIVNIGGGDFTITVNVNSACASITYESNAFNSPTVSVSSGITMDISGALTIPRADNTLPDINTFAVGAGILNVGSIAFTNGGGGQRHVLTISTGTVTVSGDVTETGSNGSATITFTGAGLLRLGGAFLNSNNCTFTAGTGTVEYMGAGQTVGDFNYFNLTLSGSGTKDLTNVNTIDGNFVMSGTAAASAADNIDINGSVTLGSGTSFTAGGFTHTIAGNWTNNGATFTATGSTINFNGAGQTIGGTSSNTFAFLTLSGSGTKVFGASTLIDATLSVATGVVVNLGTITTHTARTLVLNNAPQVSGTWGGTTSGATNINTTFFATATGILTVSNRIYFTRQTGNWNANTTWSTVTYANTTNTGTFPVAGDIVNVGGGSFTITVNVNSACAYITYQSNATASPVVSLNSGITLNVSGAITIPRASNNNPDVNTLAVGAGVLTAGSIAFTNGGGGQRHALTISTGTATVSGNISQEGSTGSATITFTGSGLLRVGGTFLTSATCTFTPGTGTVEYNGTVAQTVGDFTYYNLTLNNTSATIPQLSLTANTTATNTLTMTSGILNLNGATFTLGASGAASSLSRTVSSTTNWMYGGTFSRFWPAATAITSSSGNFYGLFPVGASTASSYRPVTINSTVNPTATGFFRVTHTNTASTTDLSPVFNDGGVNIVRKHNAQFVTTSSVTGGTYDITVSMTGLSAGTLSDIRLGVSNGATTVTTVGTHAAATGTASNPTAGRTGVSLANLIGDFRITTANSVATPLPVELSFFKGELIGNEVNLSWRTESELNNDFFTIERSVGAEDFSALHVVKGHGTTNQANAYSFLDPFPLSGRSYYRLKQTDFDGTFTYSKIISIVSNGPELAVMQVYPNPSNGTEINLEFTGLNGQETIRVIVYDYLGREHSQIQLAADSKTGYIRQQHVFKERLPKGVYILKAGPGEYLTKRLLVTD